MLNELHGKDVVVHLGIVSGLTDSVRGRVVASDDVWIKVQTKKQLEFIPLAAIKRIVVSQ